MAKLLTGSTVAGKIIETTTGAQAKVTKAETDSKEYTDTKISQIPVTDISGKVDKVSGKQLSTEDYTTAEKTKLAGVETGANNYAHPSSHPASMITESAAKRFVTDAEKSNWNAKETSTESQAKATKALTDAKSYTDLEVGKIPATTWSGIAGKPTSFTPSTHSHTITDVTGLQVALDNKSPKVTVDNHITDAQKHVNTLSSQTVTNSPEAYPMGYSLFYSVSYNDWMASVGIGGANRIIVETFRASTANKQKVSFFSPTSPYKINAIFERASLVGGSWGGWSRIDRGISYGTTAPTGGVDGDVYFQYE